LGFILADYFFYSPFKLLADIRFDGQFVYIFLVDFLFFIQEFILERYRLFLHNYAFVFAVDKTAELAQFYTYFCRLFGFNISKK
jgi:hypothetical protein